VAEATCAILRPPDPAAGRASLVVPPKTVLRLLQGVSVNSAAGKTTQELSTIKHGQVGVTTVGQVRQAGGTVTPSPTPNNPDHCTMCGLTPQDASKLFTPTIPNLNKTKPPQEP
jgi:hypothetical protein